MALSMALRICYEKSSLMANICSVHRTILPITGSRGTPVIATALSMTILWKISHIDALLNNTNEPCIVGFCYYTPINQKKKSMSIISFSLVKWISQLSLVAPFSQLCLHLCDFPAHQRFSGCEVRPCGITRKQTLAKPGHRFHDLIK